jgi:hypothetical protein
MKIISTTYGVSIEEFDQPKENITNELLDKLFEPIYKNKIKIFETTRSIERLLEQIIAEYFCGDFNETSKDYRNRFNNLILSSDWCTFASKLKLGLHIIEDLKLLEKKSKEEFEQLLRKTMSYRNAFAHGETSTDGRIVMLKYFEKKPMKKTLDESFFSTAEKTLNKCYYMTDKIARKMNLIRTQ